MWASLCGGFSCWGAQASAQASAGAVPGLRRTGPVVVLHGLSCSPASGIFPAQGLSLCLLHRQADSWPLSYHGSSHPHSWKVFLLTVVVLFSFFMLNQSPISSNFRVWEFRISQLPHFFWSPSMSFHRSVSKNFYLWFSYSFTRLLTCGFHYTYSLLMFIGCTSGLVSFIQFGKCSVIVSSNISSTLCFYFHWNDNIFILLTFLV